MPSAAGFHLTSQLCACGCDTRLPSTLVNCGRSYLRGHKGFNGKLFPRKPRKEQSPGPGPVHSVSMADVLKFLRAQENLLLSQLSANHTALEETEQRLQLICASGRQLEQERKKVTAALEALADNGSKEANQ